MPEHIAARALLALARSYDVVLDEIGRLAGALPCPPVSVIVFGSFGRREATPDSDIDLVVVRPEETDADDDAWSESLDGFRRGVRRLTGNPVEVLEVSAEQASSRLTGRSSVWAAIRREGRVVHGVELDRLRRVRSA